MIGQDPFQRRPDGLQFAIQVQALIEESRITIDSLVDQREQQALAGDVELPGQELWRPEQRGVAFSQVSYGSTLRITWVLHARRAGPLSG